MLCEQRDTVTAGPATQISSSAVVLDSPAYVQLDEPCAPSRSFAVSSDTGDGDKHQTEGTELRCAEQIAVENDYYSSDIEASGSHAHADPSLLFCFYCGDRFNSQVIFICFACAHHSCIQKFYFPADTKVTHLLKPTRLGCVVISSHSGADWASKRSSLRGSPPGSLPRYGNFCDGTSNRSLITRKYAYINSQNSRSITCTSSHGLLFK